MHYHCPAKGEFFRNLSRGFHGLLSDNTVSDEQKPSLYIVAEYINCNCNWMGNLNSALKIEIVFHKCSKNKYYICGKI